MDVNSDWFEQLMLLKDLTQKSGVLHEAQIMQLKFYPRFLFDDSKTVLYLDQDAKNVKFDIVSQVDFESARKRSLELFNWVEVLLGAKWSVSIDVTDPQGNKLLKDYSNV